MRADHDPSPPADDDVAVLRATIDALVEQVAGLTARVRTLEGAPPPEPTADPEPSNAPHGTIGRRRALAGLAGAAAAGAAVVAGGAQPAAADNGQALVLGSVSNTATAATGLTVQGIGATGGLAVTDNSVSNPGAVNGAAAVFGHARGANFDTGVFGYTEGAAAAAVIGEAAGGAGGTGVWGRSHTGTAGFFESAGTGTASVSALQLNPAGVAYSANAPIHLRCIPTDEAVPPSRNRASAVGQLSWTTSQGALWACIGAGTPGTWRKVVGAGTAGAFHLLPAPVRIYDSRAGTTPSQGPKTPLPAGNVARTIDCKHNGSGVPNGATGVVITVLLASAATGSGNLTIWANDKPKPQSNTMVWGGSAGRFTTTALSALDAQARIKIDASLQTHVILDVVGYYR
jgi:hypothetical protein